jgi:hypothetical protein
MTQSGHSGPSALLPPFRDAQGRTQNARHLQGCGPARRQRILSYVHDVHAALFATHAYALARFGMFSILNVQPSGTLRDTLLKSRRLNGT